MAHFAEIDENNIVTRVIVVADEHEADGENWCNSFLGGNWKQTSYNHNFRKQYAGKGYTFDAAKNKFISPQPYDSWALDGNDDWQAPVTYPTDTGTVEDPKFISWDEAGQKWTATDNSDPVNNFNWDASGLTWVSA